MLCLTNSIVSNKLGDYCIRSYLILIRKFYTVCTLPSDSIHTSSGIFNYCLADINCSLKASYGIILCFILLFRVSN